MTGETAPGRPKGVVLRVVLLLLVSGPVVFNAIGLWPELSVAVPSLNDDAHHFLFIQRASDALERGQNPVDHWNPEVELGFPHFYYYQHLPHLVVVALHRLLLKKVDLLTLFNLVRYLLLVLFPVTVYRAMRGLGFSPVSSAVGASASALFTSNHGFGLEYGSYTWRGYGMYTQLWAAHLSLAVLVCLNRLVEKGKGYAAAVAACSLLGLSHLVYTYMMVPAGIVILAIGLNRRNVKARCVRLAVVGGLAGVVTSYLSVPLVLGKAYMLASLYLDRQRYDSYGAGPILTSLANGDLFDFGRLPLLTLLAALGLAAAVFVRSRPALLAVGLLLAWLALYFGRPTWGSLLNFLPMQEGFPFHRLIGGVHLAALLLIGLGGEWIWRQARMLRDPGGAVVLGIGIAILLGPAFSQKRRENDQGGRWMEAARNAIKADVDASTILSALRTLPPGRVYAGLKEKWGGEMQFGELRFYNLLTFHRVVAVTPPYASISLNADFLWHFDDRNPVHYDLFNVRYVIAPRGTPMADFLRPLKETPRYTLYEVATTGYARFLTIARRESFATQSAFFLRNRDWLLGPDPAAGRFAEIDYPSKRDSEQELSAGPGLLDPASFGVRVAGEKVSPGRFDLSVECPRAAVLVIKETFHPNWLVRADGRPLQTFMVSPSYIGMNVPAGTREIGAEYRTPLYKHILLALGMSTGLAVLAARRLFDRLERALAPAPDRVRVK